MKSVSSILSKLFIFIMAIITLFPFIYMILASLMTFQEATSIPPTLIPKVPQWNNFIVAMQQAPFVRYFYMVRAWPLRTRKRVASGAQEDELAGSLVG